MDQSSKRPEFEAQIMERAARDPNFRERLKSNPRETISHELGISIPADLTIEIVEDTASTVHLVLPPATANPREELSEGDLEGVAGGYAQDQTDLGSCARTGDCCS